MSLPGPVVAIVGPTASGKSALAESLARLLSSSVISVDAMQVYRGMDIGTAKVAAHERRCPLLMVDVCDVACDYSVKLYQHDARACVNRLLDEGKTPVLCGGTGLYLGAIIDDMRFPAGSASDDRRSAYEATLARYGAQYLYEQLMSRDPASAALIHPHNARRVIRALEMCDEGGSYATQKEHFRQLEAVYDAHIWGISCDRAVLYARIDARVDEMFAAGLVEEVRGLLSQGLASSHTASQAIGYKEVLQALDGELSMDEARELIKRRTRQYAKRQLSWFGRDKRISWIEVDDVDKTARMIAESIKAVQED